MFHHAEYKGAGYPTALRLFGRNSLQRLTYIWMFFTILAGAYMADVFVISNSWITYVLVAAAILCYVSSFQLLVKNFELKLAPINLSSALCLPTSSFKIIMLPLESNNAQA